MKDKSGQDHQMHIFINTRWRVISRSELKGAKNGYLKAKWFVGYVWLSIRYTFGRHNVQTKNCYNVVAFIAYMSFQTFKITIFITMLMGTSLKIRWH